MTPADRTARIRAYRGAPSGERRHWRQRLAADVIARLASDIAEGRIARLPSPVLKASEIVSQAKEHA